MAKTDYITNGKEKKKEKRGKGSRKEKRRGVEERKRMEEEWKRAGKRGSKEEAVKR